MTSVARAYAALAAEYTKVVGTMSAVRPSDRRIVEAWADRTDGRILDAGCGPGHWTSHLHGLGHEIYGIDTVAEFLRLARSTYPHTRYERGSVDAISESDASLGGVLAWFSLIHHEPSRIAVPLSEFARVLRPGGSLLLGYFHGRALAPIHHTVAPAFEWPQDVMRDELSSAGFETTQMYRRSEPGRRTVGAIICKRREPSATVAVT